MATGNYPRPDLSRAAEEAAAPHDVGVIIRPASEPSIPALSMPGEINHDTLRLLLDGGDTRGTTALVEYTIAPRGDGPGLHWHRTFDEYFYVVTGTLSMEAAGRRAHFGSRDFVFVPRGVVHDFWNDSADTPCVFLSGWTPAGSEGVWKVGDLPEEIRSDPDLLRTAVESLMDAVPVDTPRLHGTK